MFLYAGKVLSALVAPVMFVFAALVILAIHVRGLHRMLAALAALTLIAFGSGACSKFLLRTLEQPYIETSINSTPSVPIIVVLGGYLRIEDSTPRPIEIGSAADRLLCAAELYRAGKAPIILLSGGNASFLSKSGSLPEAVAASRILEEWGIPQSAILIEDRSQSTRENAEFSHRILAERGINRILLVTSAVHMRRASGSFRKTGLTVIPFAADFLAESNAPDMVLSLFPSASGLVDSGLAIKEWSGLIVYRLRGWSD